MISIKKIINYGIECMSMSLSKSHDIGHAKRIVRHMKNIHREFLEKGYEEAFGITLETIEAVGYCHDIYKAGFTDYDPRSLILEDFRSARILSQRFPSIHSSVKYEEILHAIRYHNRSTIFFFLNRNKYSYITQLLYEADNIEALNYSRAVKGFDRTPRLILNAGYILYGMYILISNIILNKSEYAKEHYRLG